MKCKTHERSVVLWQPKPTIMLHPVITWISIWQNCSFSPKENDVFLNSQKEKCRAYFHCYELWLLLIFKTQAQTWTSKAEVTDAAYIQHVWRTVGNMKSCEVWYFTYKICGASIPGKQNIQYSIPTVSPLLTSKTCPEIQEDSYWSNPSMIR